MMQKRVNVRIEQIKKANDKIYIYDTLDTIIDTLHDFEKIVSNISFFREQNVFLLKFELKISKTADILWVLIKEFLNTIYETEPNLEISISEIDEGCERGTTYKFFNYIPEDRT